ncbi:hypothetical protein H5410_004466 [Solanum commersonii]|uniref:Uncharacterized protein n=1 Tax=Solanum commersonii TaxID=4109 RepID=A0A9J6B7F8_SOLCO|nr:hypothetical protein H5410_004466 [Solanum commersonii]
MKRGSYKIFFYSGSSIFIEEAQGAYSLSSSSRTQDFQTNNTHSEKTMLAAKKEQELNMERTRHTFES